MKTPFKCPYNEFSCLHINTCGMSVEKSCQDCEHSHNGVKATGSMPVLEAIYNGLKKLFNLYKG
jgi:hypothetical protein